MPSDGRLRPSAFLRCSEAQPEEKFVHRAICFLAEFGMMLSEALFGPPTLMIQTPVVAEGGEEVVCEVRPPNSTVTDFDRVIDQPADLKSSSCMAVIISSHKNTVAMMNSVHSLLSENHPCTLFMASLLPGYHAPPNPIHHILGLTTNLEPRDFGRLVIL
jgi:hypothetical protein